MSDTLILLGIYGCLIFVFFGIFVQANEGEKGSKKLGVGTLFFCSVLWPLSLLIGIGRFIAS